MAVEELRGLLDVVPAAGAVVREVLPEVGLVVRGLRRRRRGGRRRRHFHHDVLLERLFYPFDHRPSMPVVEGRNIQAILGVVYFITRLAIRACPKYGVWH